MSMVVTVKVIDEMAELLRRADSSMYCAYFRAEDAEKKGERMAHVNVARDLIVQAGSALNKARAVRPSRKKRRSIKAVK